MRAESKNRVTRKKRRLHEYANDPNFKKCSRPIANAVNSAVLSDGTSTCQLRIEKNRR